MAVNTLSEGGTVFVMTDRRLDSSNAGAFKDELEFAARGASRSVVIDMQGLDYISSAGLRAIMQSVRKMEQQGGSLALCSLSSDVRAVFETSGFDQLVAIHSNRAEASAVVATGL